MDTKFEKASKLILILILAGTFRIDENYKLSLHFDENEVRLIFNDKFCIQKTIYSKKNLNETINNIENLLEFYENISKINIEKKETISFFLSSYLKNGIFNININSGFALKIKDESIYLVDKDFDFKKYPSKKMDYNDCIIDSLILFENVSGQKFEGFY